MEKEKQKKYLFQAFAFAFFLFMAAGKLMNASLWYDETVEYYYSKAPFSEMYGLIISTFQPPLYNFVMHFWLMIRDGELWFRLSGVVFGFFGCLGLYGSIDRLCDYKAACWGVIGYSTLYYVMYYTQECAEYSLMLGLLPWVCCFFLAVLEDPGKKQIAGFLLFSALAVYTQYGAAFVVAAAAIVALAEYLAAKNWPAVKRLVLGYAAAVAVAGIPLILLFTLPQIKSQGTADVGGMHIGDIFDGICSNFRILLQLLFLHTTNWSLDTVFIPCLVLFLALTVLLIVCRRQRPYRGLAFTALLAFFLYYVAMKAGLYGYGSLSAGRYTLFLVPVWTILLAATLGGALVQARTLLAENAPARIPRQKLCGRLLLYGTGLLLTGCLLQGANNMRELHSYWLKDDIRGATQAWYDTSAYEDPTFVYYAAQYGFRFYYEHMDDAAVQNQAQILYQPWDRGISAEDFKAYLEKAFAGQMPERLNVVASHIRWDFSTIMEVFEDMGYTSTPVFEGHNARLLRLEK